RATGADNVGGAMTAVGESFLQKAIAMAHHSAFSVGGARWHNAAYEGRADTVFGGFYQRSVFERIGLFDETLVRNQDDEFNLRLRRAGGQIWHSPRIRSWYHPRASLRALFRQYLQYGYWKVGLIGFYLCGDLLAAALTARRSWKFFLPLAAVFPVYHFGYGIGFVAGLWDFCVRRRAPAQTFTGLTRSPAPLERA